MLLTRFKMLLRIGSDFTMLEITKNLVTRFRAFWSQPNDATRPVMRELLNVLQARAAGCWKREGDELVCLEFVAVENMPLEVREGFRDVMQRVSLSRIELGCVRAAAEMQPIFAREDAAQHGLVGSASWLQRFGAGQSLAIPIVQNGNAIGVLAIATVDHFDESSVVWQTISAMVAAVAEAD